MQGITILPANLATLVLESFLYGILLLLFISTVYFLATRRTLAGPRKTAKHHLTSTVFLGVTALFLVVTVHWSIVIYQAFYAFIHLGSAVAEDVFYADLAEPPEVAKAVVLFTAILLGDGLVTIRLWIIWSGNRCVVLLPMFFLLGMAVASVGMILEITNWQQRLRGAPFVKEERPWTATGFALSLLANIYSTGFISYRICRVTKMTSESGSRLSWFLAILVESFALQTLWLMFCAMTLFSSSDLDFIGTDSFPVILGIANTLIHARVGLGWSPDCSAQKPQTSPQNGGEIV
ncbi:hypothetical protein DFH06DRAFT_572932 [Mycena polygramma]|nr:hypothetical protein DFH06DRAFT_572932 [Mycena polygramma]